MTAQEPQENTDVQTLVTQLASDNLRVRKTARESLVTLGSHDVTAALVAELSDPRDHVRWEAAKALAALADPVSASALVNALDDDNADVRWVVGEALIALGKTGIMAVLHALTKRASSLTFRESAAHVLHDRLQLGYSNILAPVKTALRGWEPATSVPQAAYDALLDLKTGIRQQRS